MSFSADQFGMSVIEPGGAVIKDSSYKGDGSTTFAKGDLVRINTSGQIVDAGTDSDTTGPCHGMILDNWTTAPTTSQYVPILQFASDTVLASQLYNATAADAEPQDIAVGTSLTLRNGAAGIWSVTTTTTKGIALVVDIKATDTWFNDGDDDDEDYGIVLVRFTQANIDARGA